MFRIWLHSLFFWLAIVLPFLSWRKRGDYRRGAEGKRPSTGQLYARVIVGQWLVTLLVVGIFVYVGMPLAALGLAAPRPVPTLVALVVLTLPK